MDEIHREVIRENFIYIGENLVLKDILDFLVGEMVLTEDMQEEILAEKTKKDKIAKFLFILPRRGPGAFEKFLEGLDSTKQDFIADRLRQSYSEM